MCVLPRACLRWGWWGGAVVVVGGGSGQRQPDAFLLERCDLQQRDQAGRVVHHRRRHRYFQPAVSPTEAHAAAVRSRKDGVAGAKSGHAAEEQQPAS